MFSLKNFFFFPFEECGQELHVGLVIIVIKFFKAFGFCILQILSIYIFFLIEFCKRCVIHGFVINFSSFLLTFLSSACIKDNEGMDMIIVKVSSD